MSTLKREDGRAFDELRPVKITRNYLKYPEGSVLIEAGDTRVICTATVEEKVPPHKKGTGSGWVTAEYAMLPRSTLERTPREGNSVTARGRTQEIRRLIGRALRAVVDLEALGERSILLDADVIQADGGTRTLSITGAFVALNDAVNKLLKDKKIKKSPLKKILAATSVGIIKNTPLLDLTYKEDVMAEVDMNVVMTEDGDFVEVQGTAEGRPFSKKALDALLKLAAKGINELIFLQRKVLR